MRFLIDFHPKGCPNIVCMSVLNPVRDVRSEQIRVMLQNYVLLFFCLINQPFISVYYVCVSVYLKKICSSVCFWDIMTQFPLFSVVSLWKVSMQASLTFNLYFVLMFFCLKPLHSSSHSVETQTLVLTHFNFKNWCPTSPVTVTLRQQNPMFHSFNPHKTVTPLLHFSSQNSQLSSVINLNILNFMFRFLSDFQPKAAPTLSVCLPVLNPLLRREAVLAVRPPDCPYVLMSFILTTLFSRFIALIS